MPDTISPSRPEKSHKKGSSSKSPLSSPTRSKTTAKCAALDASGTVCNIPTKPGMSWCSRHNEERVKLYVNYKKYHTALDAFPEDGICRDDDQVLTCCSLDVLNDWNRVLMAQYQLLTRCISARQYFTERFFSNDMDFGHKTYWDSLIRQRGEVEQRLLTIETRGYQLILLKQNALWVLDRQPEESEEDCSGHDNTPLLAKVSKPTAEVIDVEDPLDVALREKAWELREKIRARLARYCAPSFSRYYQERLKVIFACVRRAIYTDPALMLFVQKYKSVMSLLQDSANLDVPMVEKLWKAISTLSVLDVRAAVDDVLRPQGGGDYVQLLGGRVYKDIDCTNWPLHAWGHLTAIYMCYSCVRRTCKTVDEIVALTRFVVITDSTRYLSQSILKYTYGYEGDLTLVLCGFIPNSMTSQGPRYVTTKTKYSFDKNFHLWKETMTNPVICAGLSLTDPKSQTFVNKCLKRPDFMVLVRKGAEGRIIKSLPKIWGVKVRKARSKAELATIPWDSVSDVVYFQDSILEEAWPIVSVLGDKLEDCLQVAIIDRGEGEMGDFVLKLEQVWLDVYGAQDRYDLFRRLGNPLVESGEIDFKGKRDETMVPNIEEDVMKSYKRLWGVEPKTLADDEYESSRLIKV